MTHAAEATARTVIGIIGNVLSFIMFISPAPSTFRRIWKKKSTEEFHPYPQLATTMNCLLWIFYGLPIVHPDSTLLVTINAVGLALQIIYLTIFFLYTTKKYRVVIGLFLLAEIIFLAGVAAVTLLCFHTHEKRSLFVGIITVIFGIIMYSSPLSNVRDVIKTKSVEFMQSWLIVAGFTNGLLWTVYGFLKSFDPFVVTANGVGALFGFFQLSLFIYYGYIRKPDDVKPSEVQLPNRNNLNV